MLAAGPRGVFAHDIGLNSTPLKQPSSPVQLQACYLGTNFMFGDPQLKSEESKLQLSADLAKPVPTEYQKIGLRFELGTHSKHTSDIVVFTDATEHAHDVMFSPAGLDPSGYLPRVAGYEDYVCGVDFATSLDRKSTWFDAQSDVVPCAGSQTPISEEPKVFLTALEISPSSTDAVFLLAKGQASAFWRLGAGAVQSGRDDGFGRVVGRVLTPNRTAYVLHYGAEPDNLDQTVCFYPMRP